MIDCSKIREEIARLEASDRTSYSICERLAMLYCVLDHMEGHHRAEPAPVAHDEPRRYHLDAVMAEAWTAKMVSADGLRGHHWTMDQTNQVLRQRGYTCDPAEFYAIINAMWSDYCKVAQKFGVDNLDFWAELAHAWLDDKDAQPDKAGRYYKYIVKH